MVGVGCEPRIDVILKMQNSWGVDMNQELKLYWKCKKKKESRGSGGCDYSRAGESGGWI